MNPGDRAHGPARSTLLSPARAAPSRSVPDAPKSDVPIARIALDRCFATSRVRLLPGVRVHGGAALPARPIRQRADQTESARFGPAAFRWAVELDPDTSEPSCDPYRLSSLPFSATPPDAARLSVP